MHISNLYFSVLTAILAHVDLQKDHDKKPLEQNLVVTKRERVSLFFLLLPTVNKKCFILQNNKTIAIKPLKNVDHHNTNQSLCLFHNK